MGINVVFNGATIWVPGVYTKTVPATGALSLPHLMMEELLMVHLVFLFSRQILVQNLI